MERKCKHSILTKDKICVACKNSVLDTNNKYDFNSQILMYQKRSLKDKFVRKLESEVKKGKTLLFLDIDETLLHIEHD